MINLGLSSHEQGLFNASLINPHQVAFRVHALDLSHNLIEDLSDRFMDGQVNFDASKDPVRDASLTLQSSSLFSFETNALTTGAAFAQVMVSVEYGVRSELLPRWVWVPLFVGPVTAFDRKDDTVDVTAMGKEQLLLKANVWRGKTYPKGTKKTDLLRDMLHQHGETRVDIPDWPTKTTALFTSTPDSLLWPQLRSLGHSWGSGTLTYDGRGYCRLFNPGGHTKWTFADGYGGSVVSEPQVSYTLGDDFTNACRVYGPTPAKGKKQIFAEYVAPASHPLSPAGLARNGSPTYYATINREGTITTQAAANALAKKTVEDGLAGAVTANFDAVPVPHLEPWDLAILRTEKYHASFRMSTFSIPLNADGVMSVGYNRKVSKWTKHGRRKL